MHTDWELVVGGSLSTDVVYSDLSIRATSAVSGLGVWLVLLVSIAAGWSSSHFY